MKKISGMELKVSDNTVSKIERERKSLLRYYWWQVFWGVVFLVLVIVSSVVLGFRSEKFWLYLVIPLIVIGSFWIYVQTTRKNVDQRLNQRAFSILKDELFEEWTFYPSYVLDPEIFKRAGFIAKFSTLRSRNGLLGNIDGRKIIISFVSAESLRDEQQYFAFAGVFVTIEQKFPLPVFAVYPKGADVDELSIKFGLQQIEVKLSSEFNVLASDDAEEEKIDFLGPLIMKYSHLCTDNEHFYFSTLNKRINIGLNDMKDLVNFDIKQPITKELVEEQLERLKVCLEFVDELCERVKY